MDKPKTTSVTISTMFQVHTEFAAMEPNAWDILLAFTRALGGLKTFEDPSQLNEVIAGLEKMWNDKLDEITSVTN